jgi:hypothetical protein
MDSKTTMVLGLVFGASLGTVGCSGDDTAKNGMIRVVYSELYSAYEPTKTYKVPVMVPGVFDVRWSVSDGAVAEIEQYEDDPLSSGSEAMVIAKGPGTVKVLASVGGITGEATLVVSGSSPTLWEVGRRRYQEGPRIRNDIPDKTAACTNCHGPGGRDVEHTPAQIGGYSDQQLINIFTLGMKPPGAKFRILSPEQWTPIHQWQMTEEEKNGVVVYLRSLEPTSQGTSDFGGRGVFRGSRRTNMGNPGGGGAQADAGP